jgi:heptosyltransferase-2/heptosyltransferase-3
VFFFCRLGDMVMLTSMLNLLHQRYGLPCQVIGTGSWSSSMYLGNPDVSGVWAFHRHWPFPLDAAWPAVRRVLRDSAPGPIYVSERHYRQLPRIRRMLKWAGVDPRRCVFLTDEPVEERVHLVDRMVRLGSRTPAAFQASDYPVPPLSSVQGPRLFILEAEKAERDTHLKSRGWLGRELILIQPGNHRSMGPKRDRWRRLNTDDKWWPLERWAELFQRIHEYRKDALIVLRGSPEEVPMLQEIQAVSKLSSVVVDGHGLRPMFSLIESAQSMISVDTGPAHAAAALSVPLVVLYGVHSPAHWLPRSPSGSPVIGVGGPPITRRVDQVSVDTVFNAWLDAVNDKNPSAKDSYTRSPRSLPQES